MRTGVVLLLAIWLLLSIVNQCRPAQARWTRPLLRFIDRYDVLFLIPDYPFFAPTPTMFDNEVLYRDRLADGAVTTWRSLDRPTTTAWRAVWNPAKRRQRLLYEQCVRLRREARLLLDRGGDPDRLYLTEPYVSLAHCIAGAPHSIGSRETQFMVAVSAGFDGRRAPAVAFISPFFAL